MNLISGQRAAVPVKTRLAIVRVVSVPNSMTGAGTCGDEVAAAIRRGRMNEDDGLAPVELVHHRRERRIAEPFVAVARHQDDAVGLERVERVFDFLEAGIDIRQRQDGERAEAPRAVAGEFGAVFVADPRQRHRGRIVAVPDAGRGDREYRGGDAGLVHVGDRFLRRPVERRPFEQFALAEIGDIGRRRQMMMDVDDRRLRRRRFRPGAWPSKPAQGQAGGAAQDVAAIERRTFQRHRLIAAGAAAQRIFAVDRKRHLFLPLWCFSFRPTVTRQTRRSRHFSNAGSIGTR